MIYRIGNQKLKIPETGTNRKKRTPRQVVPWRDVAETCRTLDAICSTIETKPRKIIDGIARSGFWAAVFRDRWPKCNLLLNEEERECWGTLLDNFPNCRKNKLRANDIKKWTPPKSDISLLDFDHFTLRILDEWKDVLSRWSPKAEYFIIADGACFGFKFGTMKHYNIKKPEEYFYLLDEALKGIIEKQITVVSMFMNASTILLENKKPKEIKFLPPSNLFLSRGGKIYKQGVKSKSKKKLFNLTG